MRSPLSRRGFLAAGSGLAAAAALPAMSGCSTLASADSDPGTLVVHTQLGTTAPGSPTYTAAVKDFEKENPGLRVKNLVNGDDLPQVYETSRLARKEPDVVMVNLYDKTLAWTDVGATVDVKDYLDDWGLRDRVLPAALTEWTDDEGRIRAFPTSPPTGRSPSTPTCSTAPVSARSPPPGTSSSVPRGSCGPRASHR